MRHKGQESRFRKVVWVEEKNVAGWGCSECAWVFSPAGQFTDESLAEMEWRFRRQLIEGFCFPQLRRAPPKRTCCLIVGIVAFPTDNAAHCGAQSSCG